MESHDHKHINKDRFADSAGVSWEGRSFDANPYADDDGTARPELISAIEAFHQSGNASEVFNEFAKSRLLIPLLADLGESEIGAHGQVVDKSADLSIVTVETPDQQTALPVFSSVETMQRWNPTARPVPASAVRVALAAASEGNTRILLDAGSPTEFAFRRAAIAAIAQEKNWAPPQLDQEVIIEFENSIAGEEMIPRIKVESGDLQSRLQGAEIQITIGAKPGLASNELEAIVKRITDRWAASDNIAAKVDSIALKVRIVKED